MYLIKRARLFLLFPFLGAIIMCIVGGIALQRGFGKWEPLGKPSDHIFKIIGPAHVQTKSGDVYQYGVHPGCENECWAKTADPLIDSEFWLPIDNCGELPDLSEFVDSLAVCNYYGLGFSLTILAVDEEGNVYRWNEKIDEEDDSSIPYLYSLAGGAVGLLIGVFVLFAVMFSDLLNWLRRREQGVDSSEKKTSS